MRTSLTRAGAALAMLGLSLASGLPGGIAQAADNDVVGHVYVNNNTTANTISGFDRHADGRLTPISGSPFATGGAGIGAVTPSQGALDLTTDGRWLVAVNPGNSSLSVLRVNPASGALALVEDSPVSSWGLRPVSVAVSRSGLVYTANAGGGGSNYTGFQLSPEGRLVHIAGSTYDLPDNAAPGQVLFNSTGSRLVGVRVGPDAGPSYIDSFLIGDNGTLVVGANSPFPSTHVGPFGSRFNPTNPNHLLVTNAHDGAGNGSLSSYLLDSDGRLTEVAGSPARNGETGTCWLEVSKDGRYAYAVNTGTNSVSTYSVAPTGRLTFMGNTPIPGASKPFDAGLDRSGRFLYVVNAGGASVSAFSVGSSGTLTPLAGGSFATAAGTPFGLVAQ